MSTVAAIQMASGPNVQANLLEAAGLIGNAAEAGAELIVLPENFGMMGMKPEDVLKVMEQPGSGLMQDFLADQAKKYGVWLVGGTVPLSSSDEKRVRQSCLLFDDKGEQVARYDKLHLFDVQIEESGDSYHESSVIEPGNEAVVVDTPFGKLGLAICYDLRFPELFRQLVDKGMEIAAVPSAFTSITGKAHWEPLVRARAIENLSHVVAAAQGGYHINGRATYGHSVIVDPWGSKLAEMSQGVGYVSARLDRERLNSTRKNFPVIEHRRLRCEMV
ncbi:MAG: carbon-nitrogen hydrolase family protein [Gammaproteobacteria bacterium]|nr:carbon-nitrogen hydrolase family protein [Gammaproteobacteria bacterium]